MKIIPNLNIRTRSFLVTLLATVFYLFFRTTNFFPSISSNVFPILIDGAVVSLLTFLGASWIIDFKFSKKQIINLLLLPSIFTFTITVFSRLSLLSNLFSLKGGVFMLFLTVFLVLGLYFMLLNTNILNISNIMNIPLERAGKSVNYIFSIIIFFLLLVTVLSIDISSYFKIILLSFLIFFLNSQSINLITKIAPTKAVQLAIIFTIVMILILIGMMMFAIEPQFPALVLTAIYYMTIGVLYEEGHHLSLLTIIEYSTTLIILIAIFFIFANFGIYKLI